MSEENANPVNEAVADILQRAIEGVDTATEFISAELPDVVTQLLMWKQTEALITSILALTLLFAGLFIAFRAHWLDNIRENWFDLSVRRRRALNKGIRPSSDRCNFYWILGVIGSVLGAGTSLIAVPSGILTFTQIQVAPKVYLLEYMRGML